MQSKQFKLEPRPYLLKNRIQNYEWGTKDGEAAIPKLLGFEPEAGKPYAELWIGAHPKAPSIVEFAGQEISLPELISSSPLEILGQNSLGNFDSKLPFLLKVLSASEALSIQAHPDKTKAKALHAKDPKNYPDENHKPEIAIALDSLTALVGLKPLDKMLLVIGNYKAIEEFIGNEVLSEAENKSKLNDLEDTGIVKAIYETIMKKSISEPEKLKESIQKIKESILNKNTDELTEEEKLFLELENKYGSDVGLYSLFLFNLVHLSPGEGIFLNAGIPHAYLKGNIIECMANSDNVVRAGLTPKFKDIDSLLDILSYENTPITPINQETEPGEYVYKIPVKDFDIKRWEYPDGTEKTVDNNSICILLVAEGGVQIGDSKDIYPFKKGDSILIPAVLKNFKLKFRNNALVFMAYVP